MNNNINKLDSIVLTYKNFKSEYITPSPILYLVYLAVSVALIGFFSCVSLVLFGWGHAFDIVGIYFILYFYECYCLKKKLKNIREQEDYYNNLYRYYK
jgi:hypothetical protein